MRLSKFRVPGAIAGLALLVGTTLIGTTAPPAMAIRPDCYKGPQPNCGLRMSNREAQIVITSGVIAGGAVVCTASAGALCPAVVGILSVLIGGTLGEDIKNEIGRGNCIYIDNTWNRYHRIIDCNNGRLIRQLW
jgi:hypothetical protein